MRNLAAASILSLCLTGGTFAQAPPIYLPFDGIVVDEFGTPRTGNISLVFSLYEDKVDGVPVWVEVQPVMLGPDGSYQVLLGGASGGVPADPFVSGVARWLGVQPEGMPEGPRSRLLSVPYAAKAADADTVGGLPASSFILSPDVEGAGLASAGVTSGLSADSNSGTVNGLDNNTDNLDTNTENVYVTKRVGIGTSSPMRQLHMVGGDNNPLVIDVAADRHAGLWLRENGTSKWQFYNDYFTDDYRLFSYGKPGVVLALEDVTGRLGLGTVAPSAKLHLADTGSSLLHLESTSSAAQIRLVNSGNSNGFIQYSEGNLRFFANSLSQPTLTLAGGSPGNVGIGTASPSSKLHVNGNVVVIDTEASNQVIPSGAAYDTGVAGAVSAQPGLVLGIAGDDKVLVAQSGRVKVKTDASFGPITAGDILVTSPTPGHAMRSEPVDLGPVTVHRPGTVLGKALESLESGRGEILVLLTLQ